MDSGDEPMKVAFSCSGCGKSYSLGEEHYGKLVRCKECGQTTRAPEKPADAGGAKVRFECPSCGKAQAASSTLAGTRITCTGCGTSIKVPGGPVKVATAAAPARNRPAEKKSVSTPLDDIYGSEPFDDIYADDDVSPVSAGSRQYEDAPPRSEAKQPPRRSSRKRQGMPPYAITVAISIGALVLIVAVGVGIYRQLASGSFGSHREQVAAARIARDEADLEGLLLRPDASEAREWLDPDKYPDHSVRTMGAKRAREVVNGFYDRGAEKVMVVDTTRAGDKLVTSTLIVQLPPDQSRRAMCLDWEAAANDKGAPEKDRGQKFATILTD